MRQEIDDRLGKAEILFCVGVVVSAVVYWVNLGFEFTRAATERPESYMVLVPLGIGLLGAVGKMLDTDRNWALVGLIFATPSAIPGFFNICAGIIGAVAFFLEQIPVLPARIIGTAILCALGGILFLFRFHARACYGFTEIVFGSFIGWHQLPQTTSKDWDLSKTLSIGTVLVTGCVYLIVRGLDNMQQGYKDDKLLTRLARSFGKRLP